MTKLQKLLTAAALVLFCTSVMLAPWANKFGEYKYQEMFLAPEERGYHLQWQNLIVEWLAIGILYGWLFWLCKHMPNTKTRLAALFAIAVGLALLVLYYGVRG